MATMRPREDMDPDAVLARVPNELRARPGDDLIDVDGALTVEEQDEIEDRQTRRRAWLAARGVTILSEMRRRHHPLYQTATDPRDPR